jgi:branched-chain amino acid transport system substrate-binding protein
MVGFQRRIVLSVALATVFSSAFAEKKYDPGASDTEIKIGQTKPYSGPASAYSSAGHVQAGYFEKINSEGGINGRKLKLFSLDDAFTPPKTVEQPRKLVEQEQGATAALRRQTVGALRGRDRELSKG